MSEIAATGGAPVSIVQSIDRHLKWVALDGLERVLMILCGICLAAFSTAVFFDVVTREIGHPWLWLQEVTSAFFTYASSAAPAWPCAATIICICPRSRRI